MKLLLFSISFIFFHFIVFSQGLNNSTGLNTSIAVDIVAQGRTNKLNEGESSDPAISPRESEILLYAPVDQIFDGQLSVAAHEEADGTLLELHEAFISSSKLIERARFRIGQYFLNLGRLNRFHRHDWPFTTAPESHQNFFDNEGVLDVGSEVSYLLPTSFYLDVTFGVTRGWSYGHSHSIGEKPISPTHYSRVATFFGDALSGLEVGVNYLGRTDSSGKSSKLYGFDLVHKIRSGRVIDFLLQAEFYQRDIKPQGGVVDQTQGGYLYLQLGLDPMWSLGTRFDYYSVISRKEVSGNKINNLNYAYVPQVTYKASEFSTVRLSYSDWRETVENKVRNKVQKVELQFVYLLGAHPAHNF